ncbi:hypothetical protein NVI2019_GHJFPKLH_02268 [Providencia alcalifaciens]|nr:hypothetical protein NVI2019_GHJFPKLH_02268 [Providencia alcalifaciens]
MNGRGYRAEMRFCSSVMDYGYPKVTLGVNDDKKC